MVSPKIAVGTKGSAQSQHRFLKVKKKEKKGEGE